MPPDVVKAAVLQSSQAHNRKSKFIIFGDSIVVIEQAAIGKFITAIARLKETFAELARSLRLQAGVKSVVQWLDIPLLGDGYRIELYTDAEMSDGRALGWRLEVAWSGQNWIVEGGVTINDATGQRHFSRNPPTLHQV